MEPIELHLTHKRQTKANDCWYASIQMLKSWRAGKKDKPRGDHTLHLHRGELGHRLHASSTESKHFTHVLTENGLKCLPTDEFDLADADMVSTCLHKYGPIIIGGAFGEIGPFKGLGHFIVLAGLRGNAAQRSFKIYDPATSRPGWVSSQQVVRNYWGGDESAIALDLA